MGDNFQLFFTWLETSLNENHHKIHRLRVNNNKQRWLIKNLRKWIEKNFVIGCFDQLSWYSTLIFAPDLEHISY